MVFNMKENKTVNRFSLSSLFVSVFSLDGELGLEWVGEHDAELSQCSPSDRPLAKSSSLCSKELITFQAIFDVLKDHIKGNLNKHHKNKSSDFSQFMCIPCDS